MMSVERLRVAYWLEAEGYDVTYCSNLDIHADPDLLRLSQVFVSVGHDEYWTEPMYDHVTQARDAGVSLLFLSGNSVDCVVTPYTNSRMGAPFRSFARLRPWRNNQALIGATTYGADYGDWVVTRPEHWLYQGTGLQQGDRIVGLIGWEGHGPPLAEIEGLEVVAGSAMGSPSALAHRGWPEPRLCSNEHTAVIYPGP
jgi:hypothetical protein